ncbi:MAG: carbohydrate ABC transporter permease [Ruminococcaceae bacterium]|nr:carbohydrate ABC transporter permease [Oscillospiraceae bacterium]
MKKLRTRKHEVVLNRSVGGDSAITVVLAIFGFVMILPLYYTVIQALKPLDELFYFPPRFYVVNPTLGNFRMLFDLMGDSWVPFSRYIFNTVLISVAGTLGNLIFSSLAAYALAKIDFPGGKAIFWLIQKSLMIGGTVTGLVNFITLSWLGWVDTYAAVIVPAFASSLGLYLMKQFMESNVTTEILESARLDGASELRTFWSIAMPMVKPAWLTLIIYAFQGLWGQGSTNLIYSEQLKTLNYAIGQILSAGITRTGASCASTVIMMMVPIIVFIVSQSNIIETMGSSGMKD